MIEVEVKAHVTDFKEIKDKLSFVRCSRSENRISRGYLL